MRTAAYLLFLFLIPALALWSAKRSKVLNMLGPVVMCYAAGISISIFKLPGLEIIATKISEVMVPLAIPLLLMGRNLWVELKQTGKGLQAFGLACLSVCIVSLIMGWLFHPVLPQSWQLAGMLVGVYTGAMTNLVAVGQALQVDNNNFILIQAADVLTGGVFLLIMLSVMKPFLLMFLPAWKGESPEEIEDAQEHTGFAWKDVILGLLCSIVIAGVSLGTSFLLLHKLSIPLVMFLLTVLALLASTRPAIHNLKGTEATGDYLIQIFCVAIGCQVQMDHLMSSSGPILVFTTLIMLVSMALHYILAKFIGHDADTTLMASVATIYGAPFVAPMAEAMKNRALIGPGITLAVLGAAVGTWMGLGVSYALKLILGVH